MIGVSNAWNDERIKVLIRLRKYRSKVAEYQACKQLYDSLYPSGVQHLSDMPTYRSDVFEPERWAQRRIDQAARMQTSLDEMRDALNDAESLLDCLNGYEKAVITRRYLLGEYMPDIAERLKKSIKSCGRIHDRAIDMIARKGIANG